MGRKSQTKDSDLSEIKKLKYENQKLKKEVSRLRKMVSRHEDHYEEVIESAQSEIVEQTTAREEKALLKQWKCFNCTGGTLLISFFDRPDGKFYKRKCSACSYATRLKPHNPEVKGITHELFREIQSVD